MAISAVLAWSTFASANRSRISSQHCGNFDNGRSFLAYSPDAQHTDAYIAYDASYTDGPFLNPGRYRRDNVNANYTRTLDDTQKLGFRIIFGRNDFYSSGQVPLDLVATRVLDRFGYVD